LNAWEDAYAQSECASVAATNRNLEKMVATEFRSDLFYRLNVFPIRIPSLRERKKIFPTLSYFVQKFAKQMQKQIESVPSAVMKGLTAWMAGISRIGEFHRTRSHPERGKALEYAHRTAKDRNRDAIDPVVVNKKRAARISFLQDLRSTLALRSTKGSSARKSYRRLLVQGPRSGTDGAASIGISRTTLIYRMRRLGIYAKLYS